MATVYSNASARFDFVVEWAKNRAANKSPIPVNTIPSPIVGINIECLVLAAPGSNLKNNAKCENIFKKKEQMKIPKKKILNKLTIFLTQKTDQLII